MQLIIYRDKIHMLVNEFFFSFLTFNEGVKQNEIGLV